MGNRSYLLTERGGAFDLQLEANNLLPLLWVACVGIAQTERFGALPAAALGLDEDTRGLSVPLPDALGHLRQRRALVDRWLGSAGATVLDQFAQLLGASEAERVHLALDEWVDLNNSADEALAILRRTVEALDTDPSKGTAKRRPPKIKWLMDEYGLSGVEDSAPLFGLALGGACDDRSEPWRREPPRARRIPGEAEYWSNTDVMVSRDGNVIVAWLQNSARLNTPLIWRRREGSVTRLQIPEAIEQLHFETMTDDASWLFGVCVSHPGKQAFNVRCDGNTLDLAPTPQADTMFIRACSDDGARVAGFSSVPGDWRQEMASMRAWAAPWGTPATPLDPQRRSDATIMTPDGRVVAGVSETSPGEASRERAFLWSEQNGLRHVGPEYASVKWVALAPDASCGVLEIIYQRGERTSFAYWTSKDDSIRPIDGVDGAIVQRLRVSARCSAVLGKAGPNELVLWTPAAAPVRIALPEGPKDISALYVTDDGMHAVFDVSFDDAHYCRDMVLWSANEGLRSFPIATLAHERKIFFRAANRAASLDDFVAVGDDISDGRPLIWTLAGGVQLFPYERPRG